MRTKLHGFHWSKASSSSAVLAWKGKTSGDVMRAPSDTFLCMYKGKVKFGKHNIKCYGEKKKLFYLCNRPDDKEKSWL